MKNFDANSLVIATHNAGKVVEISRLLSGHVSHFSSAIDLNIPEPKETGNSFIENAELKASLAAAHSNMIALADDSGLRVEALNGAPGIYSARWAGPNKDFTAAMARIENELGTHENRKASFVCALSLAWPDGHCETVEGILHGHLTFPPRGDHGFGYDPIFIPEGYTETFAEMSATTKQKISHRADAFRKLVKKCFQ